MGGNVIVKNLAGSDVASEKIDFLKCNRSNFIVAAKKLFSDINKIHANTFGEYLWIESDIQDASIFNGSSSFMLDETLDDSEILNIKSHMGDIDVATPEKFAENLLTILNEHQGQIISTNVEFIGHNRVSGKLGTQINCVFKFIELNLNVQVDFEFLPFENSKPTEWAKFSHSSALDDIKLGIKAVHHKYLMRALVGAISARPDIVIATSKSTSENVNITAASKRGEIPRMLKFSVDHGVRIAYEPLLDENGNKVLVDQKLVYKEITTKNSRYEKSLRSIFQIIFGTLNEDDLNLLWTYKGVLDLCKKYCTLDQQKDIANRYFEMLWGIHAQELERSNPEEDFRIKITGWEFLKSYMGIDNPEDYTLIISLYYKGYRS